MKPPRVRQYGRILVGGAILFGALAAGPLLPQATHAQLSGCKSDPIVTLNNGKTLQLVSSVSDSATDVSKILYYVQVPAGVAINKITFTGGSLAGKEQVQQQASQPANTYNVYTTVTTGTTGMAVTVTDSLLLSNTTLASGSTSGKSTSSSGTSGTGSSAILVTLNG